MRLTTRPVLVALLGSGIALAACGARTGLRNPPPDAVSDAGLEAESGADAGMDANLPECRISADCLVEPGQCARATCLEGACILEILRECDDADLCTRDSCDPVTLACSHEPETGDADGDGFDAPRPGFVAGTSGSCGDDCHDGNEEIHPGADEICDGLDNDCNRVIDDRLGYSVAPAAPVRVSSQMFERAWRAGFAYNGASYGLTLTGKQRTWNGFFKSIDEQGGEEVAELPVANVNAASFAGGMIWNGTMFATAWEDARQDTNYEIYFNLLDPDGNKLMADQRLSNADQFSLHPQVVWTRSEFVALWDDRRFGDPRVFGQRLDSSGAPIGLNQVLTLESLSSEYPAAAVGEQRLGVAFTTFEEDGAVHTRFRTVSFDLTELGAVVDLSAVDAINPNVAYAGGRFVVTWERRNSMSVSGPSIYGAVLSEDGGLLVAERAITSAAPFARGHGLLSLGDRIVLVWGQYQADNYDLYFKVLSPSLEELATENRVTSSATDSLNPALSVGPNGDIGVLFEEWASGPQVYFTRLSCGSVLE